MFNKESDFIEDCDNDDLNNSSLSTGSDRHAFDGTG